MAAVMTYVALGSRQVPFELRFSADLYPQRNMVNVIHKRSFKQIFTFMSGSAGFIHEGWQCYSTRRRTKSPPF